MELYKESSPEEQRSASSPIPESKQKITPKFQKTDNPSGRVLRSLVSLGLYLMIGFYIFPSPKILLLLTVIILIHEAGHFLAMKYFGYQDLGIFFIPLLGAFVAGAKREVSQKESAVIILAGPLPGIFLGILFHKMSIWSNYEGHIAGIPFFLIGQFFLLLNLINLLPIYPLDGGQLLNRIFLNEHRLLEKIFIIASAALLTWFALFAGSRPYYVLLILPLLILFRLFENKELKQAEQKITEAGISTDCDYEDLSDEDYWKIRNILIEQISSLRDVPPSPPYVYHEKEERIALIIEGLLQRYLIQDLSPAGKTGILLLWILALLSPWLADISFILFKRVGF
ncbi:MAG: hypothetical protein N2747_01405 [Chitinophagaceae bacterium]|nr:hypothetical protein [Chitinophagaceae bacterium]